MTVLFEIFLTLHFIGWAIVLGGYFVSLRGKGLSKGVFHGAATALVAGIVMMGLVEGGAVDSYRPDPWFYTKFGVALVVTVLAFVAQRQGEKVRPLVKHGVGVLTLANIVIAAFWH